MTPEQLLEGRVAELEGQVADLEAQMNGLSQMVAAMHVDLYTTLIEQADESQGTAETGI